MTSYKPSPYLANVSLRAYLQATSRATDCPQAVQVVYNTSFFDFHLKSQSVSNALNILLAQESQPPFAPYPRIPYDGPLKRLALVHYS